MADETVFKDSSLGQRLDKVSKGEARRLVYRGKEIPVVDTIRIGREAGSGNDLVLDDKMMSRYHAEVKKIKEEYFVKDLSSTNGTFVNEVKVPEQKYMKINPGDVVRFGKTELRFN